MQLRVIEIARNVFDLPDSNSTEFQSTKNPVVSLMTEWHNKNKIEKIYTESLDQVKTSFKHIKV